jgi:aerobic carbon-monoxide dehydrogenase large subunit
MGVQSIGMPVQREEDFRLLRGKGRYVDDVRLPHEARGYVVRSPHAHARICDRRPTLTLAEMALSIWAMESF